jgi:DHA1 family tetracycline resistance protein-like MFS transporter
MDTFFDEIKKKRHLTVTTALMFINMIGFSILIPVIPLLFTNPLGEYYILPSYISNHYNFLMQGMILTTYALCVFLSSPVLGELSDYYGRKKILNICFAGSAAGYFLFAYAVLTHNIWILFLSRIIDGITGGNISVLQASIIDVSNEEDRAKNISSRSSVTGIAFIFGPWISGILASKEVYHLFNPSTPFIFAGIISIFAIYLIQKYLIETVSGGNNTESMTDDEYHAYYKFSLKKLHPLSSLKLFLSGYKMKDIKIFLNLLLLFWLGFGMYSSFSQNFLVLRFNFDVKDIGYYFAYTGILLTLMQIFFVPRISKLFSSKQILNFIFPVFAAMFIIYAGFIFNVFYLLIFIFFFIAGVSLLMVHLNLIIVSHASETERGKVFGISSSVQSLAQVIAPIVGGIASSFFSYAAPFYFAAIFIFFAAILLWNYKDIK